MTPKEIINRICEAYGLQYVEREGEIGFINGKTGEAGVRKALYCEIHHNGNFIATGYDSEYNTEKAQEALIWDILWGGVLSRLPKDFFNESKDI